MENKTIQMQPYEAPLIEVLEVKVEQGFATSNNRGHGVEPLGSRPGDFAW
jgi:hypothetical protein